MHSKARWTFLLGFLFMGCASSSPGPQRCSERSPYQGPALRTAPESIWPTLAPRRPITGVLDAGLTQALDTALDAVLRQVPAASVAVAVPGQGLWTATRGKSRTDTQEPVDSASLFQVASVTKSFTAMLAGQLVQEGRLRWDTPVSTWFPEVPGTELMTLEDLLEHTHGLVSFNALPGFEDGPYRSPEELIRLSAEQPPQFCPGGNWAYSNTGYVMLGRILEQVEGKPFSVLLQDRLLRPLGLAHTEFRAAGLPLTQVVVGHVAGAPVTDLDYATPYSAGGLASTAEDLVRFWHALLPGEVLAPATVRGLFQDMHSMDVMYPPTQPGSTMFYGRGVQLYDVPTGPGLMLGHSGGIKGFSSVVAYVVEDDVFVSVVFNDSQVSAEAGLWALVRALREHRDAQALP
ncbi:serine hydrolase domain-containing protein [Myxococcus eversor]|uniref:serine hydrolase domain-containing protein n=1 Tax=Myxococcus eversor TaxID=2709661 RepID=UPI0013D8AF70|nr:serine hydrolase domain-containing protein [Myxococcus eversor]